MADIKDQKLIYHLTDINHLPSILKLGLLPRSKITSFSDVADPDILDSRKKLSLENYVPFHFFARNPFDGRVQVDHPDKDFILLAINRTLAQAQNWRVIPRHPLDSSSPVIYNYNEGFSEVDWKIMNTRSYDNAECKSICMAECLSPETVHPTRFSRIFVRSADDKTKVDLALNVAKVKTPVSVNSLMFIPR